MKDDVWTIRRMMEWMNSYLSEKGDENPLISTRWLLSDATGLGFMELYTDIDRPLSIEERAVLRESVKRRAAGEPLQYIVGKVGFRYIEVIVESGVLIPRPETEVLVSAALEQLPQTEPLLIADLCTGSGCIACSVAQERADARVIATDISAKAVSLARRNARSLGLEDRVEVIQCSLGEGLDAELLGTFDAIIANPPYVPTAILATLPKEVSTYEPPEALDGGADGLDLFRAMTLWASAALSDSGILAVELHETTLDTAASLAEDAGFVKTRIYEDLAGRPRVLVAWKSDPQEIGEDDGPSDEPLKQGKGTE